MRSAGGERHHQGVGEKGSTQLQGGGQEGSTQLQGGGQEGSTQWQGGGQKGSTKCQGAGWATKRDPLVATAREEGAPSAAPAGGGYRLVSFLASTPFGL